MKPDESNNSQSVVPLSEEQPVLISQKERSYLAPQDAAATVIRNQIDNLYESSSAEEVVKKDEQQSEHVNPYIRNHKDHPNPQSAEWKKYHTAWQEYYQKYYEGYYKHHIEIIKNQQAISSQVSDKNTPEKKSYFTAQPPGQPGENGKPTPEEMLFDLRQRLLNKVTQSAQKVRKSRHFWPIMAGIIVVVIMMFMQYNRFLVSNVMAYVSPGNIDPQNIIIDPSVELTVSKESRIIIPKINVDVPVMYDIGNDYDSQMTAMEKGLAHFSIPGASSHPGEIGNTTLAGHSSNDLFDTGDYKFIFSQLDKLQKGDTIYAHYKSKRYTYIVTGKEVVAPTEVNKLVYDTNKPVLTLLTCTPLGTATSRLLVTAEQISPDPSKSTIATPTKTVTETPSIPGTTPTFLERLFGA